MDHTGGYYMAIALMMALLHRKRTGEGQWVDLACIEAAGTLHGAASLDATVNGRPGRRDGMPHSNRSQSPAMAPHGIYPAGGDDQWVAVAVRSDEEWQALGDVVDETWCTEARFERLAGRLAAEDALDEALGRWTSSRDKREVARRLRSVGVPAAPVLLPEERIEHDPRTVDWGLWATVEHSAVGQSRVEGLPVHLSRTDWHFERGAPCLGEHNAYVFGELLGRSDSELADLTARGIL